MKYNTQEVAALQPDYLGFIFYGKSKRDFEGMEIPTLSENIKKVGVFVDADIAFAKAKIEQYHLDVIQLHGDESPGYIEELRGIKITPPLQEQLKIWKVFSIKDHFDFNQLKPYEGLVDAFLFDTKGKEKGGNGYTFNWNALKEYSSTTPIVLSGGIGLGEVDKLKKILATELPIIILDVNSKFEIEPGAKDVTKLQKFVNELELKQIQNPSAKAEDSLNQSMNIIENSEEQFYFYITTNTHDKVLYTGFTVDLKKRIKEHTDKIYKGSFTSRYNIDKLVYFETFKTVAEARAREKQVKKWNREWKENLINDINPDWKDLQWML